MPTIPITGPAKRTVGLSLNCPDRTAMTSPSANSPSPHQRIWRTSLEGPATGGGAGFGGSPSEDGEGGTSITSQLYQRPGAPKSLHRPAPRSTPIIPATPTTMPAMAAICFAS